MGSYILALDLGTSSLHCLLADSMGRPIATACAPMCYFTPDGCPSLAREFGPEVVLSTLEVLTREVLHQKGVSGGEVSAIAVTSQRQGLVFLDEKGTEIYSGPNIDLRAIFEGAAIDEELSREIYAATGHFPSLLLAPARLRWFRENRLQIYDRTTTILTIAGWLAYRLTGRVASEPSLEGEAGLLNIKEKTRHPALMDKLGVPSCLLPPLIRGNAPAGDLSRSVATLWDLRAGIPVFMVGPDTQCGLFGMGLMKEGQTGAVMGWSGALQMLTSTPCFDESMRTWVGSFPLEDMWVGESSLGDSGNAYRWLKDTLLGVDVPFEEAEGLAQQTSAAADGVMALLGPGPVSSLRAGLRPGGLFFPTPLGFQESTPGQLLRAALENVAFGVTANLATLREVTGLNTQALYLGGGMARSRTLAATLANVLGSPVRRSKLPQVSARGAAMATAVSVDPSLTSEQVAEAAATDCEEVVPSTASDVAQHQEYFQRWLNLYKRLEWEQD